MLLDSTDIQPLHLIKEFLSNARKITSLIRLEISFQIKEG
jgi:hypothetical protein